MSEKSKTVVIFVLIALLLLLGAYVLFGKNGVGNVEKKASFLNDVQDLQSSLSYYLGSTYSDTFGAYTKLEILSAKSEDSEGNLVDIKDNEDNVLVSVIDTNDKVEENEVSYYKLVNDNVKILFNVDISSYSDISWYVTEEGMIKVNFEETPNWWGSEMNGLKLGVR